MKYLILITWFFFAACTKETVQPEPPQPPIDTRPADNVIVFEQDGIWYAEASIRFPVDYIRYVEIETVHVDSRWRTLVVIPVGEVRVRQEIMKRSTVAMWKIIRWGTWQ